MRREASKGTPVSASSSDTDASEKTHECRQRSPNNLILWPKVNATPRLDDIQLPELPQLLQFVTTFWLRYANHRTEGLVLPSDGGRALDELQRELMPESGMPLPDLLQQTQELLERYTVKTSHPLFVGYVTPPALDIAAAADALASIVNQNVAFAALSPLGTALETAVIQWLGQIVGYSVPCGGILTSGGSSANLYGLAVARRDAIGPSAATDGNYTTRGDRLRIYCSTEAHHSVDKAAMLLGLGTNGVRRVPVDAEHRINTTLLATAIEEDLRERWYPFAIVGNAGTRLCCAFDDIAQLRSIADRYRLWLHVDAAYGGFLRLADNAPPETVQLPLADSIVIDPHKLLFVPFDCGALLVRKPDALASCFGADGEYIEKSGPAGLADFANLGMQLGRSMKALKVWLTIKRYGRRVLADEYTRLISLARYLHEQILSDSRFQPLGPVPGTAVCFRWRGVGRENDTTLNVENSRIRQQLLRSGVAFVDEVRLSGRTGFRVCMTNFRTGPQHVDALFKAILSIAAPATTRQPL